MLVDVEGPKHADDIYAETKVPCTYEICHIMLLQVPDTVILL
jgi:hypothetical protein